MSRIRRSLLLSFAQRYSVMVIRLCFLLTLSMADEASSDVAREKSPDGLSGYRSVSV